MKVSASKSATSPSCKTLPAILPEIPHKMKITLSLVILFILNVSCAKSKTEENQEINKILNAFIKYESDRKNLKPEKIFLVNPELQKLQIYVPSQKEILGEEPGPPPFYNKNIIHLLDFGKIDKQTRKQDSLNLLKQNKYVFDSLNIDSKLNPNIKLANKTEIYERINLYQFSNPVYFNDNLAYIETIYYETVFGIGFGYLLEKQKDGSWKVINIRNTFIT